MPRSATAPRPRSATGRNRPRALGEREPARHASSVYATWVACGHGPGTHRRPRDPRLPAPARREGRGRHRRWRRHRRRHLPAVRRARRAGRDRRDRSRPRRGQARPRSRRAGGTARAHVVDVRDDDQVAAFADAVLGRARWPHRRARQQRRRLPSARAVREVDPRVVGRDVPDQPAALLLGDAGVPRADDRQRRRIDRERPLGRGNARLPG